MRSRFVHPVICLAILAIAALPAAAALVEPIEIDGNPTCVGQGFSFGFKPQPEPPPTGTYTFPDGVNTFTITSDGTYFSFTSTLAVDAIIVKGSNSANFYNYPSEVTDDSGLHAPENASGGWAAISHIEVCYDYEVTVTKTANPTYTRTFTWTIDKTVSPESFAMFEGDSGTATYTVSVTKTAVDGSFAVAGSIVVANSTPYDATLTGVADVLSAGEAVVGEATVECGVTFPSVLAAGETLTCAYSRQLDSKDSLTNTATATTTGVVGGGTGTAAVVFGEPTGFVGPPTITVNDSNGGSQGFTGSGSWEYDATFACGDDAGTHVNTATISETGQSDDASVNVACYALNVSKDASTEFDRTYTWSILKSVVPAAVTLSTDQLYQVTYTVDLEAVPADSNYDAHGTITVHNPAPMAATLTGVTDVVGGAGAATVDCGAGVEFPYVLAAGGTLNCTWTITGLPDDSARTNTATATLRNTPTGTTGFSGYATVDFSNATPDLIDDCVTLDDTFEEAVLPESVCVAGGPTQSFSNTYTRWIGPYTVCGDYTVENEASFETDDTHATGTDGATVTVNIPCDGGCTLTPGYWKTHSSYGPAPYDDTWAQIGEDTIFFLSEQSYHRVLWTAPAGNAYYILAHAWIATELNTLNDAAVPDDVEEAFLQARTLLQTYTPAQVAALKGGKEMQVRAEILGLAYILDQYNNGLALGGPPHCSE